MAALRTQGGAAVVTGTDHPPARAADLATLFADPLTPTQQVEPIDRGRGRCDVRHR